MPKAPRSQSDDAAKLYSEASAIDCSDSPDMTHQEFRDESDINDILQRFGVLTNRREIQFGEQDFNIDLQTAMTAVAQAEEVHDRLPPELKIKYPTWRSMLNAASTGNLKEDLHRAAETKTVPPEPEPKSS